MKRSKPLMRFMAILLCAAMFITYMPTAMYVYADEVGGEPVAAAEAPAPAPEPEPAPAPAPEKVSEPAPKPEPEPAPEPEPESAPAAEAPAEEVSTEATTDADDPASEEETEAVTDQPAEAEVPGEIIEAEAEAEEEVKYPAQSFSGSVGDVSVSVDAPEGALPEGTEMSVTYVSADAVMGAVESAVDGEVKTVKAVDISFRKDGEEIEPKKAVSVHMNASGMNNEANQSIVHIDDNGAASVVTENVNSGSATFNSADFSVYIVVDSEVPSPDENAIATYEFYVGDELKSTQHIKTGDTLIDPGTLGAGDGATSIFKGWYVKEGQDIEGETPGSELTFGKKSYVPKTETIKIEAKIQTTYYVTFLGEKLNDSRGVVAVDTVTVDGPEGTEGTLDISGRSVIPKADTSAFEGWSETEDGEVIDASTPITVTKNLTLYAKVVDANWIHFDENVDWETVDSDPTYTAPVFVKKTDDLSQKEPEEPTRKGYTFVGWYKDPDCTEAFEWSGTGLDDDITLYAKWEPGEAEYTVIIWKQKVTDSKDAADDAKTYDFEESEQLTGTTGETLDKADFVSYTTYNYTGFHYSERIVIDPETVKADGTTVVNVYYDRNLLTIRFVDGTHETYVPTTSNYGNQFGLIDGEYVSLTRENEGWPFPDYHWYYQTRNDYSGTTYRTTTTNAGTQYGFVNGQMVQLTRDGNRWYANGQRYRGTCYL